ncbi:MAG: DNA-binding protein WhiA [Firmicutes bacterium]|nr:DNA-binding protein WhiA [Bacillota bacterium]
MSFSSNVKNELSHHFGKARHCNVAELAAIINLCGQILSIRGQICLKIQTEKVYIARKYFTLLKKTFNIDSEVSVRNNTRLKKNKVYTLIVKDQKKIEKLMRETGFQKDSEPEFSLEKHIDADIVKRVCCKRAFIRGAFLAAGSLSDPEKSYHMEFVNQSRDMAESMRDIINSFGMDSKIVERKGHSIVYLKEGEQIVDLLNIMEAHVSLMELENVRILKDMRNSVNRRVNCEAANIGKIVKASVKQTDNIRYIMENMDISELPDTLIETAELRLKYPDASLKELGDMMCPKVGKSGVNHRLRKLNEIANELKDNRGISHD